MPNESSSTTVDYASAPAHTGIVINHAETHENKIHSDEMAARFGFEGALVPGVTVFGLTSIALTKQLGADWMQGHTAHTRFLKPAYDNDELDIFLSADGASHEAHCLNKSGTLLCTITLDAGVAEPEFQQHHFDLSQKAAPADRANREVICWDALQEGTPFPVRPFMPTRAENAKLADEVKDTHPAFSAEQGALVHPHLLLSHANQVLVDQFEMPAWIHVGSEIRFHKALLENTEYRTFAIPIRKWKNKGHEFVTLYIAYEQNGAATTEILHTAIYRVAGA